MNNWYEFKLPYFNEQFGVDWDTFMTITDDNVDYIMNKTWQLYWLRDIGALSGLALDMAINLRKIAVTSDESTLLKRTKLRKFNTIFKSKGMPDTYLDYQEVIVGTRGEIIVASSLNGFIWDGSSWATPGNILTEDRVWSNSTTLFAIYIDVKTLDNDLLDEIVSVYSQDYLKPAFYTIYLVDSSLNILRTI